MATAGGAGARMPAAAPAIGRMLLGLCPLAPGGDALRGPGVGPGGGAAAGAAATGTAAGVRTGDRGQAAFVGGGGAAAAAKPMLTLLLPVGKAFGEAIHTVGLGHSAAAEVVTTIGENVTFAGKKVKAELMGGAGEGAGPQAGGGQSTPRPPAWLENFLSRVHIPQHNLTTEIAAEYQWILP